MSSFGLSGDSVKLNNITIGSGTSATLGTGNSETKAPIIDTKFTDDKKLEYLKSQGYSVADAQKLIQTHPELTTQEQWTAFILNNKSTGTTKSGENSTSSSANSSSNSTTTNTTNISFKDFKSADIKTKATTLADAYARNQNRENWDNMKPEEREQARINAINSLIEKNNKTGKKIDYEQIKEFLNNPAKLDKISSAKRAASENIMSDMLLDIMVADELDMSVEDFHNCNNDKSLKSTIKGRKYDYIAQLHENDIESFNSLSEDTKNFYEDETITLDAVKKFFKDQNICAGEIDEYIERHNAKITDDSKKINRATIAYDYLKAKKAEERTQSEQDLFNYYDDIVQNKGKLNQIPDFDSSNTTFIEMNKSEVYQKALQEAKNNKVTKPEYEALKTYLKDRLKAAGNDESKRFEIIKKLSEGTSRNGRILLRKALHEIDQAKITDANDVYIDKEKVDVTEFGAAVKAGILGDDVKGIATYASAKKAEVGDVTGIIGIGRVAPTDDEHVVSVAKKAGCSDKILAKVGDDLIYNYKSYSPDARTSRIRQYGNWYTEEGGIEAQSKLRQEIIKHQDEAGYEAFGGSASSYKGKGQRTLADNVMSMANYFSDDANIKAQSALANDVQNCDADNQTYIHKTIMDNSKYDDVLKLAASNIHNYDPTAQAGAIEATYATGNQAAITACEAQLNQCSGVNAAESTYANYAQNQSTSQAINNAILSGDTQKLVELVENNNIEITNYLNSCSQKDKEVFIEKYCKAANESQLLTFLKSNTSMLDLVMRYANGKISKEKVFGAVYKGNKGEIRNLLNTLGIKGADVVKLATTYKEYAPDIALAVESPALARAIITDPAAWGYQMGRTETQKLQQIASQKNITKTTETDTQPETAMTLRPSINEIDSLKFFRNKNGFLRA